MTSMSPFGIAARDYAQKHKMKVLPVEPCGKSPVLQGGYKSGTDDLKKIEEWDRAFPRANVGLTTGQASRIVVVDIDPGPGGNWFDTYSEFENQFGKTPPTWCALTGKGAHFYFRTDAPIGCPRTIPFVDVRGNGGGVVLPPSIHSSGKIYEWDALHGPDEVEIAPMPPSLEATLVALSNGRGRVGEPIACRWRDLMRGGFSEGGRSNAFASIIGYLIARNVDVGLVREVVYSINHTHTTPPLESCELDSILESICKSHLRRLSGGRNVGL